MKKNNIQTDDPKNKFANFLNHIILTPERIKGGEESIIIEDLSEYWADGQWHFSDSAIDFIIPWILNI